MTGSPRDPALIEQLTEALNGVKPLMSAKEAAIFLAVPESWVRQEARAERIPCVKLGRYTRFDRDELAAWRRARHVGPRGRS